MPASQTPRNRTPLKTIKTRIAQRLKKTLALAYVPTGTCLVSDVTFTFSNCSNSLVDDVVYN